jgi:hypothetical protein
VGSPKSWVRHAEISAVLLPPGGFSSGQKAAVASVSAAPASVASRSTRRVGCSNFASGASSTQANHESLLADSSDAGVPGALSALAVVPAAISTGPWSSFPLPTGANFASS